MSEFSFAQKTSFDQKAKKSDPFIAWVDSSGNIRSREQRFPQKQKEMVTPINVNIDLKVIVWDEKNPTALIGKDIYSVGEEIRKGIYIQEINPNSVVVSDGKSQKVFTLRRIFDNIDRWVQ